MMSDFSWKYGKASKGSFHAVCSALVYLILPIFIIDLLSDPSFPLGGSFGGKGLGPLIAILPEIESNVIFLGIILVVLAFFKWFYPKGSRSRLMFSIGFDAMFAWYAWSLLLNGRTEAAIASFGPDFPLYSLFGLLMVLVGFSVAKEIGDYVDVRREWLYRRDQPRDAMLTPLPPVRHEEVGDHHFYHDFRLRYGSFSEGIRLSRKAAKRFLIIPLVIFLLMAAILDYMSSTDLGNFQDLLRITTGALLLVGTMITAITFFKGFYPKGSYSRMAFAILVAVATAAWIWTLTFGGNIDLSASTISIHLNYQPIVLLFVFAALLWGAYAIVELRSYRSDWIDAGFMPVNDALIRQKEKMEKAQRKAERKERRKGKISQNNTVPSKGDEK